MQILHRGQTIKQLLRMKIIVCGDETQWEELIKDKADIQWLRYTGIGMKDDLRDADAFFCLNEEIPSEASHYNGPVFYNSVITPLSEIKNNSNLIRMNAWPGFLQRDLWELTGIVTENAITVLTKLNKQFIQVADTPGMVSARVLSMIINEACFANEENVSTVNEIDTAMKLGTNYPKGPFEWAEQIGWKNVHALLIKLSEHDTAYKPADQMTRML